MADYNRVVLAGNLTRDPELRFTNNGVPVCNFGLAVNRVRSKNEEVDFFDITAWRELGETIANYKKKGDPILLEGRLQFRQWENDAGERRNKVDVVADQVQFLSRGQGGDSEDGDPGGSGDGQRVAAGQDAAAASGGSGGGTGGSGAQDFDEEGFDDIPFAHRSSRRLITTDIL